MRKIRTCLLTCVVGLAAASVADAEVRLGSSAFSPGPTAKGFGWVKPRTIYNGGVPSGLIKRIRWQGWGGKTALGYGRNAIYKPVGGYFPATAKIRLKATNLGFCPGEGRAYKRLLVRIPLWPGGARGPWQAWNGDESLCGDGRRDRWKPARGGGYCGYTGEYGAAGEVRTIMASRVHCRTARKVAKKSKRKVSPSPSFGPRRSCGRRGCTVRVRGFRCKFNPIHHTDYSDGDGIPQSEPLQRVFCKRNKQTIIWWYGHFYD